MFPTTQVLFTSLEGRSTIFQDFVRLLLSSQIIGDQFDIVAFNKEILLIKFIVTLSIYLVGHPSLFTVKDRTNETPSFLYFATSISIINLQLGTTIQLNSNITKEHPIFKNTRYLRTLDLQEQLSFKNTQLQE